MSFIAAGLAKSLARENAFGRLKGRAENKKMVSRVDRGASLLLLMIATSAGNAQDSADLAKQLANPVAALISVPFQSNFDYDIGPLDEGECYTMNFQPVIPITLDKDWNLISRTIVPCVDQTDIFPGSGNQSGLGDTVQSLFFSP